MIEDETTRASGYSLLQEQVLAISPKVSSTISIPCSCFVVYEIWRERGRVTAVQRTLVAMSAVDVLASVAWFFSTWAVPAESGFAYASGNEATCNAQGFLLQVAIGAPLYNCSLALLYLLMIKMRWTDQQLRKVERWIHAVVLVWTLGTAVLLLPLGQYNHIAAVCWVIGAPKGCGNSSFQEDPGVPCERGNYAWAWGLALFYIPLWICVLACCASMVLLYQEVRQTHKRSMRYSRSIVGLQPRQTMQRSSQDTSRVAVQAILFSLSFLVTWMPSTLWSVAHWFEWSHYGLDLAAAIAEPLQGLWNCLIFLNTRPKTVARIYSNARKSVSNVSSLANMSMSTPSLIRSLSKNFSNDDLGDSSSSNNQDSSHGSSPESPAPRHDKDDHKKGENSNQPPSCGEVIDAMGEESTSNQGEASKRFGREEVLSFEEMIMELSQQNLEMDRSMKDSSRSRRSHDEEDFSRRRVDCVEEEDREGGDQEHSEVTGTRS